MLRDFILFRFLRYFFLFCFLIATNFIVIIFCVCLAIFMNFFANCLGFGEYLLSKLDNFLASYSKSDEVRHVRKKKAFEEVVEQTEGFNSVPLDTFFSAKSMEDLVNFEEEEEKKTQATQSPTQNQPEASHNSS